MVYEASGTDAAQVAVQNVAGGTRALINIDSASAPERYAFPMSGDVARLKHNQDGSVAAFDAAGALVGGFPAPWARDAAGRSVPTHYEVHGRTLVHVVKHRSARAQYGVTADPVWLGLAIKACQKVKCWKWLPNSLERQMKYGHITPAVQAFLKTWFCKKTFIC